MNIGAMILGMVLGLVFGFVFGILIEIRDSHKQLVTYHHVIKELEESNSNLYEVNQKLKARIDEWMHQHDNLIKEAPMPHFHFEHLATNENYSSFEKLEKRYLLDEIYDVLEEYIVTTPEAHLNCTRFECDIWVKPKEN